RHEAGQKQDLVGEHLGAGVFLFAGPATRFKDAGPYPMRRAFVMADEARTRPCTTRMPMSQGVKYRLAAHTRKLTKASQRVTLDHTGGRSNLSMDDSFLEHTDMHCHPLY